jgi:sialate O-acetylesterase
MVIRSRLRHEPWHSDEILAYIAHKVVPMIVLVRRCLLLALLATPLLAQATVELPILFGDGAVLQRDQPMRIWGWSEANAHVRVSFDGKQVQAIAGKDGRWLATLPAHGAGGPFVLNVTSGKDTAVAHDILVGDVYLASGQSNMEFELYKARDAKTEIARATDGAIRQFKVPNAWATTPADRLPGGSWVTASPATAGNFSAVAYFFAREIRADQHVPIGIVNSSWGGSRIEPWMDARTAGVDPHAMEVRMQREDAAEDKAVAATRRLLGKWPGVIDGKDVDYSGTTVDEADWVDLAVPAYWETLGYYDMDGIAWYRTQIEVNAAEAAAGVTLGLAMIDDSDRSYVNGQEIGHTDDAWNGQRVYRVAPGVLHAGKNTLAIRVNDLGAGGGIHGDASMLYIQDADGTRRPLTGPWRFRPTAVKLVAMQQKNQIDTLVYNKMIHPLLPLAIRGVLWYQGEQNGVDGLAFKYRDQFAALIAQWRRDFRQPALPFLYVQLANFTTNRDTADGSPWALLRESQGTALKLPATAQAIAIDVGNPDNIHPTDKQSVGHRLALAAKHVVYGQTLVYSGPVYRSMRIDGPRIRLRFATGNSHLTVRGGTAPAGFTVAGADRRFHPATAQLDGDEIVVQAADVAAPAAVRYGWRDNPVDANLANDAGLPASPFRTDRW